LLELVAWDHAGIESASANIDAKSNVIHFFIEILLVQFPPSQTNLR
jgi:hypothetical protein